jgi:nucleoside-diphosphate-sugar epimerase
MGSDCVVAPWGPTASSLRIGSGVTPCLLCEPVDALVLGGSVFVGRRLVEALLAGGHHVTVLNRGQTATDLPDAVERLVADRTDAASMRAALAGRTWDAIYDVSGFVMVAGGSDIETLLELVDGSVGHYVYVSSIMAYDQSWAGVVPWTEDQPTDPSGPGTYGGFKAVAERAMLDRHAATGFPVSVVRPAAIYGPNNNIFDMETPMFLRLLQHRPILVPHSGLVTGSYGHVDDLCEVMVSMVGNAAALGQVFNVSAEAVTTQRYVQTLAEIVGEEPDVVMIPDDRLDGLPKGIFGHLFGVRHHAVVSIDKARHLLGFAPRFDFPSGHEDTYRWFRSKGWHELDGPMADPVWRASWDFDAEAAAAAALR